MKPRPMEALNEKCGFCFLVEKKAFTRGNGVAEAEPVGAEVFWLETEMKFSCRLRPFSLQDGSAINEKLRKIQLDQKMRYVSKF